MNDTTKSIPIYHWSKSEFTISTDPEKINLNTVYQFLKSAYWAKDRTVQQMEHSIKHSLCFGVYEQENQIGFARVITDYHFCLFG